jgi:replication-associated recombination protein RarA
MKMVFVEMPIEKTMNTMQVDLNHIYNVKDEYQAQQSFQSQDEQQHGAVMVYYDEQLKLDVLRQETLLLYVEMQTVKLMHMIV